jgi:site-specific recombinase XerD
MSRKTLRQLIIQFLEYLEIEKGRSQKTIKNYDFYLRRFLSWSKINKAEKITLEKIRQYRLWLNRQTDSAGQPLQKNTQNYHLIALRSFLKYLAKIDVPSLAAEKVELAKMPERQVEFLEGEELERLLEAPMHETQKHKACSVQRYGSTKTQKHWELIQHRDKAILELLFSTGMRVSELVNLKKENINLKSSNKEASEFTVRGKGSKLRVVFLSSSAKEALKNYLSKRTDVSPFLFIRHDPAKKDGEESPLTPRSVQRMVEKYSKACGITKKVTPHTIRHSYATDLLLNGADIRSVQSMLGHASITTTQIYTHITNQQLREVYNAFHGRRKRS